MAAETVMTDASALNTKVFTDVALQAMNLAMQNATTNQKRADDAYQKWSDALDTLRLAVVQRATKDTQELDPAQAKSINKVTSGNDLAELIAGLQAGLSALTSFVKTGQTIPPVTVPVS